MEPMTKDGQDGDDDSQPYFSLLLTIRVYNTLNIKKPLYPH